MSKYPYHENWGDWSDVQRDFGDSTSEPDEVLVAVYTYEDYSGDAFIAYRNGNKYYTVEGGHCSCHGLEDQFDPEEFESKDTFLKYLKRLSEGSLYGVRGGYIPNLIKELEDETVS